MLNFVSAVLGGALLLAGRKLFWLFVSVIGFVIGVQVAMHFFNRSELFNLAAGIVLGLIFAGLAVFVERLAIGIAGFLGGGYILISLAAAFGVDKGPLMWGAFLAGGVLGVILVAALFDWALISISSLAGASMIVQAFHFGAGGAATIFIILVLIGVAVQGASLRGEHHAAEQHPHHD